MIQVFWTKNSTYELDTRAQVIRRLTGKGGEGWINGVWRMYLCIAIINGHLWIEWSEDDPHCTVLSEFVGKPPVLHA